MIRNVISKGISGRKRKINIFASHEEKQAWSENSKPEFSYHDGSAHELKLTRSGSRAARRGTVLDGCGAPVLRWYGQRIRQGAIPACSEQLTWSRGCSCFCLLDKR